MKSKKKNNPVMLGKWPQRDLKYQEFLGRQLKICSMGFNMTLGNGKFSREDILVIPNLFCLKFIKNCINHEVKDYRFIRK